MRKLELAGIGGLSASPQELKDHLNRLVEVAGKLVQDKGTARAVAGSSEPPSTLSAFATWRLLVAQRAKSD